MAFKDSVRGWLNGVTAAAADIEDSAVTNAKLAGSITNAKLSNPAKVVMQAQQSTVAAGTVILGRAPQAGTLELVGGQVGTLPSSGNLTVRFYAASNYSQLYTSGLLTSAAWTIVSGASSGYDPVTSATYAYSTVSAGDIVVATISDNGSGFGGVGNWFVVLAPS